MNSEYFWSAQEIFIHARHSLKLSEIDFLTIEGRDFGPIASCSSQKFKQAEAHHIFCNCKENWWNFRSKLIKPAGKYLIIREHKRLKETRITLPSLKILSRTRCTWLQVKKLIFTLFLGYVQDDELNMRLTPKQLHSFKKNKVRK